MLGNRLEKIMNQARLQFINLDSDDGLSPDQSSDSAKEEGGTIYTYYLSLAEPLTTEPT